MSGMSLNKPSEGAHSAPQTALPLRLLRVLANSRELMLFVLIALLALGMSVYFPNNFPTASNMRAVLLNRSEEHT